MTTTKCNGCGEEFDYEDLKNKLCYYCQFLNEEAKKERTQMEPPKLSDLAEVKLKNCLLSIKNFSLQIQIAEVEKNRILQEEIVRIGIKPEEWTLDLNTWTLIPRKPKIGVGQ
jgi:hypothetical protein